MCRSRLLLLASAAMAWETCEEDIMQADRSDARFGIWAHAWGSDPAEGPVILQCAYDWAVSDSRSKPFIRLEFANPIMIDQLIGAELAYNSESEQPPELPYEVQSEVYLELEQYGDVQTLEVQAHRIKPLTANQQTDSYVPVQWSCLTREQYSSRRKRGRPKSRRSQRVKSKKSRGPGLCGPRPVERAHVERAATPNPKV